MRNITKISENTYKWIAIILLVVYAAVGLICFDDYGCGPDEGMERQTALVNYKYAVERLNIPISEENKTWLAYLPDLKEYRDRYYGTALHFPLVLIESAFHFSLLPSQFYGLRHFYTFLNYFIGVICFYKLLSDRFSGRRYGIFGMLMMVLTPRFFAESFYNNKDIIFVAWYIICAFLMEKWFQRRGVFISIVLAFALALTCNTRFNGIIFFPVLAALLGIESLRNHSIKGWKYFLLVVCLSLLFFYLVTTNFWENPVETFRETLQFNLHHPNHGSDGNLFKGVPVDAAKIITYIPTWIAATVPPVMLLFIVSGLVIFVFKMIKYVVSGQFEKIKLTDVMMFICGFIAVLFIMVTHVTIYNSWRHCYFAYPCLVYFAVYLFQFIDDTEKRAVCTVYRVLMFGSLAYNLCWIVMNHPFEFVYFSPVVRDKANQFSGDYWSISSRALLEYIAQNDNIRVLKVNHMHSQAGSINRGLLPEEEKRYMELTYDETEDVDYYIVCRDEITDVNVVPSNYSKVFSIIVDNDEIGAVFGKQSIIRY